MHRQNHLRKHKAAMAVAALTARGMTATVGAF
jgi:hypothetical protein